MTVFSTSLCRPPPSEVRLLRVLLRGLGEYENKRRPDSEALISRFLVHYLRLFLTKLFFPLSLDYYALPHRFAVRLPDNVLYLNGFFLQEAIKDFRVIVFFMLLLVCLTNQPKEDAYSSFINN